MTEEPTQETPQETLPAPPQEEEREEPVFDLKSLLSSKKGAQFGTGEVMAYAILADIMDRREDRREERLWKREQRMNPQSNKPSPEVESLKGEILQLRKIVESLAGTIQSQQQNEAQKVFVEGVVKQTTDKIMPELQAVKEKLEEYDEKIASGQKPESSSLEEIKQTLQNMTDKIGEKVGASGKTLTDVVSDVDKLMALIDAVEKRMKHGEGGEVDYKTMTVSTLGEIGKELISAYRDVSTASPSAFGQPPEQETPASTMQTIIKRQVQNYILQRMETGATTLDVQQAAQELGLTPGQVAWAYNQLMKEGWFHVRTSQKTKGKVKQPVQEQTREETETEGASEESDQVFEPPPE